ncbi:ABC transporter permease [Terrarubrum flagellatum]|uniref:ABC transporter permease n=1 Tax=Terrirubrum flagellatum TaxID=2895980 RepID=UPI00314559D2
MIRYIALRLLALLPVAGCVVIAVFMLLHLSPGDPAAMVAGDLASPEQIARIRARLHLDQPLYLQFAIWLINLLHLDLGFSVFSDQPVARLIAQRLEPTLMLALTTTILSVAIAVPLGILAAWKARRPIDRLAMGMSVLGFSVPAFVVGYGLIYVFSINLGWFPVQGYKPISSGLAACLHSLTLPSVTLAFVFSALVARVTRAAMLEILAEDYMRTARAKGAATARLLWIHALKNAGVPVMTVIGVSFAALVGGVVVTESVFNIPGVGRLTIDAILHRDYPIVQGVILMFSALLILINLAVDLSYALFDPRIRS